MVDKITNPPSQKDLIDKVNELVDDKQDTLVSGTGIDITNDVISVTNAISTGAALGATAVQPSDLSTYVTTNTAQDITARKTFFGTKAIYFKQNTASDRLGFTLYNNNNKEVGALEFRPNTSGGTPVLTLNSSSPSGLGFPFVGFRYWNYSLNILAPFSTSLANKNFFIPITFTNGTTTVESTSTDGSVDISSLLPTKTSDLTNDSGFITGITSSDVTTALGYTPYNSSNPSGYQANVIETVKVNGTALTPSSKAVDISVPNVTSTYTATGTDAVNGIAVSNAVATKQDNLVSGTNIKTINGNSLLGSGNIVIETSSTLNVDGETISYNTSEALQTIAVKNKRDNSTLPIWQGTELQWNQGAHTTWYYWQTSVTGGWVSGGNLYTSSKWQFIASGNGRIVAQTQAFRYSSYSTDSGQTWTQGGTLPSGGGNIAFGNGKFVSISNSGAGTAYSTDGGETWAQGGNLPFSGDVRNPIIYAEDRFIAVNFYGTDTAYSTDGGETWAQGGNLPFSGLIYNIAYGNGVIVVISNGQNGAYSTNGGQTWNGFQLSESIMGCSVSYGNNRFVITGKYSNKLKVYYSIDNGVTWVKSNTDLSGFTNDNNKVVYGNNTFLVINYYISTDSNVSAYSTDGGETWQNISLPSNKSWSNIAYDNNKFVAIAYNSTDSAVFSIDYHKCYTDTATPTTSSTVYSAPEVTSGYTISSVTSGAITLSDNNTYYYNQSGNAYTYQSVGDAHPDWLCFINGVGVKIGNTTIASI